MQQFQRYPPPQSSQTIPSGSFQQQTSIMQQQTQQTKLQHQIDANDLALARRQLMAANASQSHESNAEAQNHIQL